MFRLSRYFAASIAVNLNTIEKNKSDWLEISKFLRNEKNWIPRIMETEKYEMKKALNCRPETNFGKAKKPEFFTRVGEIE